MQSSLLFVFFITPTFLGQASYTYLNCPMPYLPINPATGKMILPSTAKRIKMDIGLSHNAPNSEVWLRQWVIPFVDNFENNIFAFVQVFPTQIRKLCRRFPDMVVFGFEPNPVGSLQFPSLEFDFKQLNLLSHSTICSSFPYCAVQIE